MTVIKIESDEQWHGLRSKTVGGSEVAALFGLSPYQTAYSLWHTKAGKFPAAPHEENERQKWGKMMEPLIAAEIGRSLQWELMPSKSYFTNDRVPGMGCTLDFTVVDPQLGPGIIETKVVFEYSAYKQDWNDDRAPPNYELQVQQQLACTGFEWCGIGVFIAQTATLKPLLMRRANKEVISQIEERVAAFWKSIKDDIAPAPTGTEAEMAIMRHIWPAREPMKVVEIADAQLTNAAQLYSWATNQEKIAKTERSNNKARIMGAAKDAELLKVPGFDIYLKQDKRGSITLDVRENANNGVVAPPKETTLTSG